MTNLHDPEARVSRLSDAGGSAGAFTLLWLPILSVLLGLIASGLLMPLLGANPIQVFSDLFSFAFRDVYNIADIFAKATPLILTGLSFGFAFKANLFNIGSQGQFYMGTLACVSLGLVFSDWPAVLLLPACLMASIIAGGLWGLSVGWLKARFQANEFLVSMMSSYIAIAVVNFLIRGPLKEAKGEYPQTDVLSEAAWIPQVISGTRFHWGFFLALLMAFFAWWVLWRTGLGFRIRATGQNRDAARYAGIDERKIITTVFALAGGFAGLAGFMEVNGLQHMLVQDFSPTLGAEGIGIAILGNAHPLGIVLSSLLFGALKVGGNLLTQTSKIPPSIIGIMEGFVMLFVILSSVYGRRLVSRRLSASGSRQEKREGRNKG